MKVFIKGRLRFLAAAGLAAEQPPGIYVVSRKLPDELSKIAQKNEAVKRLYGKVSAGLDDLSVYSLKAGEGVSVTGRIVDKGIMDELYDRKYVVVQDVAAKLHFVPVGEAKAYDAIQKGSLVALKAGDQSNGKADYNIDDLGYEWGD